MSRVRWKADERGPAVEDEHLKSSKQSNSSYDPALTQLFASSFGPAKIPGKAALYDAVPSALKPARFGKKESGAAISSKKLAAGSKSVNYSTQERRLFRKRKRKGEDENDIEGRHMRQLVSGEGYDRNQLTTENSRFTKEKFEKPAQDHKIVSSDWCSESGNPNVGDSDDTDGTGEEPPQVTIASNKDTELGKASRTVFLANVSMSAITNKSAKKTLMDHLASFIPKLPTSDVPHAIESLRFRSTAFADSKMTKKASFIKRELMENTTKSTNAYVVYTTQAAAREAIKALNGMMILDRHLRVDSVAHPAKQDHRRCVFIGNLDFVDDTTSIDTAKNEEFKSKLRNGRAPADAEEGLWRQFGKAGNVESVRVVRDKTTRVGKGFAYVQFLDAHAVEKALLWNGKKFPPLLPRILRVTRAKGFTKMKYARDDRDRHANKKPGANKGLNKAIQKPSTEFKSLAGRANRLLGRAGAAQVMKRHIGEIKVKKSTKSSNKRAEYFKKFKHE